MSACTTKMAALLALIALSCSAFGCGGFDGAPAETYACSEPVPESADHPRAADFQAALDDAVSDNMPGMMLAIRSSNGQLWRGAGGQADLASGVDMQTCHMSRAGSVAKPFVAVLVMQLVDEGKISLDDTLADHLPADLVADIPNVDDATLREVLSHTSGIPDYAMQPSYATTAFNDPTRAISMHESLDFVRGIDADFAPGEDWNYSNTGYELLSFLVVELTGKDFETALQERILDPLGLVDTYLPLDDSTPAGTVRGYFDNHGDGEVFDVTDYQLGSTSAAGALVTTTHDLTVFIEALFAGELVSAQSLEVMKTPVEVSRDKIPDELSAHGLFYRETDHGEAWGHSGDVFGYHGEVMHFPASGATYALLTNGNFGKALYTVKKEFRPELHRLLH